MVDTSALLPGSNDGLSYDVSLLLWFLKTLLVILSLRHAGVKGPSLALFAASGVFIGLLTVAALASGGRIFKSNASPPAQCFSFTVGFLIAILLSGAGSNPLTFFSAATTQGAYLSILGSISTLQETVINVLIAPWAENSLLIYGIGPAMYLLVRAIARGAGVELSKEAVLGIVAVPLGLIFAGLHGASSLPFVVLAVVIMGMWWFGESYEDATVKQMIPFLPVGFLLGVGWHQQHNQIQSAFGYFDMIVKLLSDPNQYMNFIGVIEGGWALLIVIGTLIYLVTRGGVVLDVVEGVVGDLV
jgi:hypothetical protein